MYVHSRGLHDDTLYHGMTLPAWQQFVAQLGVAASVECKHSASVSNVSKSLIKLELNRIELIVDCRCWEPESLIGSHWLGGCKNAVTVHHELSSHPGLCIAFKGSRLKPMQVEARHHATVLRKFGSAFEQQGAGARPLDSSQVARKMLRGGPANVCKSSWITLMPHIPRELHQQKLRLFLMFPVSHSPQDTHIETNCWDEAAQWKSRSGCTPSSLI